MAFMCLPVSNLESYEYFSMGICRSLDYKFNFVNMIFPVKEAIFFPIKFCKKISWKVYYRIVLFLFLLLLMFLWMSKFFFAESNFLPRLIKQESYSSPHCIFQRYYALNPRSIKILRRSVVKVSITLLIKL